MVTLTQSESAILKITEEVTLCSAFELFSNRHLWRWSYSSLLLSYVGEGTGYYFCPGVGLDKTGFVEGDLK